MSYSLCFIHAFVTLKVRAFLFIMVFNIILRQVLQFLVIEATGQFQVKQQTRHQVSNPTCTMSA